MHADATSKKITIINLNKATLETNPLAVDFLSFMHASLPGAKTIFCSLLEICVACIPHAQFEWRTLFKCEIYYLPPCCAWQPRCVRASYRSCRAA